MASQFQLLVYEGYLGKDPEMRYTPNGTAVTNFNLGSTRSYMANGEKVDEVTWLRVTAWGKLAEFIYNNAVKGSHVFVQGVLRPSKNGSPNTFQLKNGEWASSFDVTARQIRLISSPQHPNSNQVEELTDDVEFFDEDVAEMPY